MKTILKIIFFLGLAIGLAMLTKGTSYIFLAPVLLFFGVFIIYKLIKTKNYKILPHGFLLIFVVLLINFGHFSRNYKINNDILNIDETEAKMYSNDTMNASFLFSNFLKNVGFHLGYPILKESDILIKKFMKI